jgi:hypothetical protein
VLIASERRNEGLEKVSVDDSGRLGSEIRRNAIDAGLAVQRAREFADTRGRQVAPRFPNLKLNKGMIVDQPSGDGRTRAS